MQTLRLGWIALTFAVLSACSLENPSVIPRDAGFGPCGREGQRCCDPRDRLPDGGGPTNCNAGLACVPTPMGRDAGVGAVGVCQACPSDRIVCDGACVDPASRSPLRWLRHRVRPRPGLCRRHGWRQRRARRRRSPRRGARIGPAFACVVDCASMAGTTRCDSRVRQSPQLTLANCGACGTRCGLANAANVCTDGMCAVQVLLCGLRQLRQRPAQRLRGQHADRRQPLRRLRQPLQSPQCDRRLRERNLPDHGLQHRLRRLRSDLPPTAARSTSPPTPTTARAAAHAAPPWQGATALCNAGVCSLDTTMCTAPLASCDGNSTNGCEVNTHTNVATTVAPVATPAPWPTAPPPAPAAAARWVRATRAAPTATACWRRLRGQHTQTDTNHCGACGSACNLPNATAVCVAGGCRVMACNAGFRDCDGMVSNGCEQAVSTPTTPTAGPAATRARAAAFAAAAPAPAPAGRPSAWRPTRASIC
jgi:hypothetical protein